MIFAYAAGYSGALVAGTALGGLGMVIILSQGLLTVPLQVELRQGWVSALELLRQFISVSLIVVLIVVGAGVAPFLAVTIPAGAITLAITAYHRPRPRIRTAGVPPRDHVAARPRRDPVRPRDRPERACTCG